MGNKEHGRSFCHATTRVVVSITTAALLVTTTALVARSSAESPRMQLSADSTALIVCGTGCPTIDDANMELLVDQFIAPTHPGQAITPVAVTTPEEFWPVTGLLRIIASVTGDPRLFGPGGPVWPDVPVWKLSGLFERTADQSLEAGAEALMEAIAAHASDHLIVYGNSQGAGVVNVVKNRLAEKYPAGTAAPDISFVLGSDPNLPNGGLASRFAGLYIPILDLSFNGAARTDTQFHSDSIIRQYDGGADLPLYPANVISDLNAVLGFFYLHTRPFDVSLADDASAPIVSTDPSGKNTYYFFHTQDLPLFAPLRQLGVPESLIDVVEPFFRVLVDMGYDRSIPPWKSTPAQLIPRLNPAKVITDLVDAVGEGVDNAAALVGLPPMSKPSAPNTLAARPDDDVQPEVDETDTSDQLTLVHTAGRTDKQTESDHLDSTGSGTESEETPEIDPSPDQVAGSAEADEDSSGQNAADTTSDPTDDTSDDDSATNEGPSSTRAASHDHDSSTGDASADGDAE